MYEKIKEDIAQEYYVKNYPNDGQRFVAWYLRNIHNLDTFEAKACITDGAGDKQIDAVYIDDQSSKPPLTAPRAPFPENQEMPVIRLARSASE